MKVLRILFTLLCLGVLGGCYIDPGPPSYRGYYPGEGRYHRQSAPPYVSLSNFGMSIHSPLQRRRLCDTRTVLTSRRSRNHTAR